MASEQPDDLRSVIEHLDSEIERASSRAASLAALIRDNADTIRRRLEHGFIPQGTPRPASSLTFTLGRHRGLIEARDAAARALAGKEVLDGE